MNSALAKRLLFAQMRTYLSIPSLMWMLGCALDSLAWEQITNMNILIFQESIDDYRRQGLDVTIEKVLVHELQHIAIYRKKLRQVEPLMSLAHEYGIIEGIKTPMKFHLVKPHWMLPNVPMSEFYSHAKLENYEVEWYEVPQDSVCISPRPSNQI